MSGDDEKTIVGIHHVALSASERATNVAFYRDVLGLSLCRDDKAPSDDHGHLGYRAGQTADQTFLHFLVRGEGETVTGSGSVVGVTLRTRSGYEDGFHYWGDRMDDAGVVFEADWNVTWLSFRDPDGMLLEIGLAYSDPDPDGPTTYEGREEVPQPVELTHVSRVILRSPDPLASAGFVQDALGLRMTRPVTEKGQLFNQSRAATIIWEQGPPRATASDDALPNHAAFTVSPDHLERWRLDLGKKGVEIGDRHAFPQLGLEGFVFTDPMGVPFEIVARAT